MQLDGHSAQSDAVAPRPLAELLQCPPSTGVVLNRAAQCLSFEAGQAVFHQSDACLGLYLVISGEFQRRTERLSTRLSLGSARPGDLVELAAALGDTRHTYTLSAITASSVMMLPIDALQGAFETHPPLRMHLLEELAREVSRAYVACCRARISKARRYRAKAD